MHHHSTAINLGNSTLMQYCHLIYCPYSPLPAVPTESSTWDPVQDTMWHLGGLCLQPPFTGCSTSAFLCFSWWKASGFEPSWVMNSRESPMEAGIPVLRNKGPDLWFCSLSGDTECWRTWSCLDLQPGKLRPRAGV